MVEHGETIAYLVDAKRFEDLIDRLEDLVDVVKGMRVIKEMRENPESLIDAEEVFKELGL